MTRRREWLGRGRRRRPDLPTGVACHTSTNTSITNNNNNNTSTNTNTNTLAQVLLVTPAAILPLLHLPQPKLLFAKKGLHKYPIPSFAHTPKIEIPGSQKLQIILDFPQKGFAEKVALCVEPIVLLIMLYCFNHTCCHRKGVPTTRCHQHLDFFARETKVFHIRIECHPGPY